MLGRADALLRRLNCKIGGSAGVLQRGKDRVFDKRAPLSAQGRAAEPGYRERLRAPIQMARDFCVGGNRASQFSMNILQFLKHTQSQLNRPKEVGEKR